MQPAAEKQSPGRDEFQIELSPSRLKEFCQPPTTRSLARKMLRVGLDLEGVYKEV